MKKECECGICDNEFKDGCLLEQHIWIHVTSQIRCVHCVNEINTIKLSRNHIETRRAANAGVLVVGVCCKLEMASENTCYDTSRSLISRPAKGKFSIKGWGLSRWGHVRHRNKSWIILS